MTVTLNFNRINLDSGPNMDISNLSPPKSELIPIGKSGIHIKDKNKGKFTEYCGGHITDKKIQAAKHSDNPTIRKRAIFAENARKWARKHLMGGPIFALYNAGPDFVKSTNNDSDDAIDFSEYFATATPSTAFDVVSLLGDPGANETPLLETATTPSRTYEIGSVARTFLTPETTLPAVNVTYEPQMLGRQTGIANFKKAFDKAASKNQDLKKYEKLFTQLAKVESGFISDIQNGLGAPAYGYFLFMLDGKKYNNVSHYANVDLNTFRNNPEIQMHAAYNLAKDFEKLFTKKDLALAKAKGYSMSALIAGAWMGGVGGVRKVLNGTGNPSDRHWSSTGKGSDVKTYMLKFNNLEVS